MRIRFVAENRFSDPVEVLIDDIMVFAGPSGSSRLIAPDQAASIEKSPAFELVSRASSGRGSTEWAITLNRPVAVRAQLFDVQGRLIRKLSDATLGAGDHVLRWDGRTQSGATAVSGVYWLRIQADREERTAKFVFVR